MKFKCFRCGHQWESRVEKPSACPACKSYKWQTPKAKLTPTCNSCGVIDEFCNGNSVGYCRACYEEATSEGGNES